MPPKKKQSTAAAKARRGVKRERSPESEPESEEAFHSGEEEMVQQHTTPGKATATKSMKTENAGASATKKSTKSKKQSKPKARVKREPAEGSGSEHSSVEEEEEEQEQRQQSRTPQQHQRGTSRAAAASPGNRGKSSSSNDGDSGDDEEDQAGEHSSSRSRSPSGELVAELLPPEAAPSPALRQPFADPHEVRERLVIRDIDVENFKSYYGRHRIGPFHKTFTAVIGPNGSGKSNVIDSMLFVFGRNAKKIRLDKLSELIHSSAAHPNLSYASVTVNFVRVRENAAEEKDPDQRVVVPNSELRIKREVLRSGVSQYYIDSQRRTQKEVVDRLIQEGVDLEHNRFLILQGEVEQIALMKPKAEKEGEEGLLEYLDDLIGTNEFVDRISDLTKRGEAAQLERLEALDREQKLKQEREALDEAKNTAVGFVTKDNQLQKTLIVMCQLRMQSHEADLVAPRAALAEIEQRIGTMEADVEAKRTAKIAAEDTAARCKREMAEAVKARDAVRGEKQNMEAALEKLKSGEDDHERARKKVTEQIKKCKDDAHKALLEQQDAEREATIHQRNHEEATDAAAELEARQEKLTQELLPVLRPLRQELEEKKKAVAPYERAVTEAAEALRSATARLEALDAAAAKREQQTTQLQEGIDAQAARLAEVAEVLRQADDPDRQAQVLQLQDAVAEATRRKYATNRTIEELKSAAREGMADDRAMEFLLSQRSLKGYYGTLRQLGKIDDQYDIAAGVASNAWGFHVVEDRATATAALELLKKNNIGRATMMVVSEIEREMGERARKEFRSPNPKAQRLFDLIKPTNEKFRTVFYQAVRDTLVVQTLSEARETGFGRGPHERYRVTTVKGELVEPSGTITGGGAAPRGAKLKAARSPQDKQQIREQLEALQAELTQQAAEEQRLRQQLLALQDGARQLTPDQLRKLRGEQRSIAANLDNDKLRLAQMRKEAAAAAQETEEKRLALQDDVADCEAAQKRAVRTRDAEHKDIEVLVEKERSLGGGALQEVMEKLRKEQKRVEAEEAALRQCRRQAQKFRATHERKLANVAELQKRLEEVNEEAANGAKEKIAETNAAIEELTRKLNAAEKTVADAQTRVEESRAALPVVSSALVDAQKALDEEQRYKNSEESKIAGYVQEIEKYSEKIASCEYKIRENADLYGIETLQLDFRERERAQQLMDEEGEEEGDKDDDDDEEDEEDEDDDNGSGDESADDEANENEEEGRKGGRAGAGKRGRRGGSTDKSGPPRKRRRTRELTIADIKKMSFRLTPEELATCDYERSVHLAKALSDETKRLHGEIDFRAISLWRERDLAHRAARDAYLAKKAQSDELEEELRDLKERRRHGFMSVFQHIRGKLKEVYQLLTHGGDADMELVDSNDPFEGINFVVRPPKKSWKQISNLSGGEKTLSSLALIFALHHIKPTPIYVMDEIDAALDFRNVSIVANYVLRQATGAQFIIISLRNNMFEMAHQLVGVCKVNDVTSTLVLVPRAFQRRMEQRLARHRRPSPPPPAEHAGTPVCSNSQHGGARLPPDDSNTRTPSSGARSTCARPSAGEDLATRPDGAEEEEEELNGDSGSSAVLSKNTLTSAQTASSMGSSGAESGAPASARPSRKSVRFSDDVGQRPSYAHF